MNFLDPRVDYIKKRFEKIDRVIGVSSAKGGVGKTTISVFTSLLLKQKGYKTGLLDLDIYGPSTHIILGVKNRKLKENFGVEPLDIDNLKFFSSVFFTDNKPFPMRGDELSNAILEILTIVNWDELDFLIIDMPPGFGEPTLDLLRLIKKIEFLIITNPSIISLETVKKLIQILNEGKYKILGVIENMKSTEDDLIVKSCEELKIDYLGSIPYFYDIETIFGNVDTMIESNVSLYLDRILNKILI
ncbi:MAG TPA: P-loop NTPase [Caldisericia bacterium]|nr:ATP-binding protein [bacterium]HQJ56524.1 P-loop NTPase [Caldisericia bacterium]